MALPLEHAVQTVLTPFNAKIRKAVQRGFKGYLRKLAGGANMLKRTDATEISDCVLKELSKEFEGDGRVVILTGGGTVRFLFNGSVLVRFKKADRKGCGMNLRTPANDDFLNPHLPYLDAPTAMKVEICWKLNAMGTGFESLIVNARRGVGTLWSYKMPGGDQQVLPFLARETPVKKPPVDKPARRSVAKIRPVKGNNKDKKDGAA